MRNKGKYISIITVTYNVSSSIVPTIESVKKLKTNEVEYIVIDGGSNDDTIDILQQYKDDIDILISEPDKGIYDAMNKGISMSNGRWINFQNAGDLLKSLPIEILADSENAAAVCGCVVSENNILTKPFYDSSILYGNKIPHQALFYNSVYKPYFNIKYKVFADYALNLQMYKKKLSIRIIDEIIALHSLDGVSMNKKHTKEIYAVLNDEFGYHRSLLLYLYWKWNGLKNRLKRNKL